MRTTQPIDAWTAYFAILTEALSASPATREARRQADQRPAAVAEVITDQRAPVAIKRGLVDRLDHWFWQQRQAATERHLAQASDIYDLEARMRSIERPAGNLF
jgi:hypothetical protein